LKDDDGDGDDDDDDDDDLVIFENSVCCFLGCDVVQ
jgi:hypothetical protein